MRPLTNWFVSLSKTDSPTVKSTIRRGLISVRFPFAVVAFQSISRAKE